MSFWGHVMSDREERRSGRRLKGRGRAAAAMKTSQGREQVGRGAGRLGTGTLAGDEKRETITLRNGAVMDALRAVSLHGRLAAMLEVTPAEFRSLLALAEGRPNDANAAHINDLREERFLAADNSVVPDVAALLTN